MNGSITLLIAAALLPAAAFAAVTDGTPPAPEEPQDARHSFALKGAIGVEHDSNVAVLEIDESSGESDHALLLDASLGYQYAMTERATLSADYAFSHTGYDEFPDFDLTIHHASVGASYDFDVADVGLNHHHIEALLDNGAFLTMRRTSPYVARLFGERLYLRGAYVRTAKRFDDDPDRDADTDALSANAFVFFNGLETFLVLGYERSDEDAATAPFEFDGDRLSAQLTHQIPLGERDLRLSSGLRYEARRYDHLTPSIAERRQDDRYRFDASVTLPLGRHLAAEARYEYADNRSNLPSVDFAEHVVSVRLEARF